VDFKADMPMSEDIFGQVIEAYRRIRNTARFLLANLYDFDPQADAVEPAEMAEVDRWAMHRLQEMVERVTQAYETFEFHRVYHTLNTFCAVDLSAFYLDMLKDRLYTSPAASSRRRSAQTALHGIVSVLARLLAPILAHTAEEIWQAVPGRREPSVQLADWPQVERRWVDAELAEGWEKILAVRGEVALALEAARQAKRVNQPLEARVTIFAPPEQQDILGHLGDELAAVLIVSQAQLAPPGAEPPAEAWRSEALSGLAVVIEPAHGDKCGRCWQRQPSVGEDEEHPTLCDRCRAAIWGI
jgi:isoleucyl-tRNA synthetase